MKCESHLANESRLFFHSFSFTFSFFFLIFLSFTLALSIIHLPFTFLICSFFDSSNHSSNEEMKYFHYTDSERVSHNERKEKAHCHCRLGDEHEELNKVKSSFHFHFASLTIHLGKYSPFVSIVFIICIVSVFGRTCFAAVMDLVRCVLDLSSF